MKLIMLISIGLFIIGIKTSIGSNFILINKKSDASISHNNSIKTINDTTFLDSLLKAVDKHFIGGTIDSFLKSKFVNRYTEYFFMECRSGYLTYLLLIYSEGVYIEIEPLKYEYLNPVNTEMKWDINLFRKEKLGIIRVSDRKEVILTIK